MISESRKYHQALCDVPECSFRSSNGWCSKFRLRHGIRETSISSARSKILEKIEDIGLSLEQVYCGIEASLAYRSLPGHASSERVSFLACTNVTGSNRMPLQVIGLDEPNDHVGVCYFQTENGYQKRETFEKYFLEVILPSIRNFNTRNSLRHGALLLLEATPFYNHYNTYVKYSDIEVMFLPATMSMEQIFNSESQSFIRSLSTSYRERLLQNSLRQAKWNNFTLDDALLWLSQSWLQMDKSIILNSWKVLLSPVVAYVEALKSVQHLLNSTEVASLLNLLHQSGINVTKANLTKWLSAIDGLPAIALSDKEIVGLVQKKTYVEEEPESQSQSAPIEEDEAAPEKLSGK